MFAFFYGVLFKPKASNVYIKNTKFAQSYGRRLDTQSFKLYRGIPAGNYLLKVNNRNTTTRYEICSKLTIKIPKRRHRRRSGIFIVNFEHISHLVLVFLLLTLSM